jgi:hypothetical protein
LGLIDERFKRDITHFQIVSRPDVPKTAGRIARFILAQDLVLLKGCQPAIPLDSAVKLSSNDFSQTSYGIHAEDTTYMKSLGVISLWQYCHKLTFVVVPLLVVDERLVRARILAVAVLFNRLPV